MARKCEWYRKHRNYRSEGRPHTVLDYDAKAGGTILRPCECVTGCARCGSWPCACDLDALRLCRACGGPLPAEYGSALVTHTGACAGRRYRGTIGG